MIKNVYSRFAHNKPQAGNNTDDFQQVKTTFCWPLNWVKFWNVEMISDIYNVCLYVFMM